MTRRRSHRSVALAGAAVLSLPLAALPEGAAGQAIRFSWNGFYSAEKEVGFAAGFGGGFRFLIPGRGIGLGIDYDRLGSSPTIRRPTCPDAGIVGPDCVTELVDVESEGDLTTFLLLLGGMGDGWGIHLGVGRTAGTFRATGLGRTTGRNADVPPADEGAGTLAWSRGADGTVLVIELLRRLPVPGPFPVSLQGAFRRHGFRMGGCVVDVYSPFCGTKTLTEIQLGIHVGLWPTSEDGA
jgi:hypothetical protein